MTAASQDHLSFSIRRSSLRNRILIPKYYDPELVAAEAAAVSEYELPALADLLLPGNLGSRLGVWIRREHYGGGNIPYVRTSDLHNWRLRPDYKKGVAQDVYDSAAARQDIKVGDILMVAHGTYLVGTAAIVTEEDLPLVLQDHIFRLRVRPSMTGSVETPPDAWLLLAALSTRFTRRQIRARQFSADIIDKIGNRHTEIRVPLPRDPERRGIVSDAVRRAVNDQTKIRRAISTILTSDMRMTRERSEARHGFSVERSSLAGRILIPKYYDPSLSTELKHAVVHTETPWISIGELISGGLLQVTTGVEIGKMAYGTGTVPFIRTTDIAELEIKSDPRQGTSQAIYEQYAEKARIEMGDVLLVRDGTYLVGASAIVTEDNLPALICGGLYRLRTLRPEVLKPQTLLGLLNLPLVRRQMRSKQFTRDVIDTLGRRFFEVEIPDPDSRFARTIGSKLGDQLREKQALRALIRSTIAGIEPKDSDGIAEPPRMVYAKLSTNALKLARESEFASSFGPCEVTVDRSRGIE